MNDRLNEPEHRTAISLGSLLTATRPARVEAVATCPVCDAEVYQQKCKVICRSEKCVYRIIYNCSEF